MSSGGGTSIIGRGGSLIAGIVVGLMIIFQAPPLRSDTPALHTVRQILEQECTQLSKDRLIALLMEQFAGNVETGISDDLRRIMTGVIKRTDFDGISEEKTVEIIGLVHQAHRKGAPLEQLDEIFDVAYVNTITVEQLYAAAQALREFSVSDVPQDIYEEFVYHSIENGWDPAVTPVLSRGLIYGVDRGLPPDKIALIIMLDVKNGELKRKTTDQLVLDAVKLVREKEPTKWKPLSQVERELASRRDRRRLLEKQKLELDSQVQQKERAMLAAREDLKELREHDGVPPAGADREMLHRDLEALIRKLQREIMQAQSRQRDVVAELESVRQDAERQQAAKEQQRKEKRQQELVRKQQDIQTKGRQGSLNKGGLIAAVDKYLGTPYRFGGDSERGIDCSAFTRRVYRSQNIELPRNSREQARVGATVGYDHVHSGDLVFFDTSISGTISHVGVFLDGSTFAHASSSKGVTKSSLREKYYVKRFVKGGRIFRD